MSRSKPIEQNSISPNAQPTRRTGRTLLYIVLGAVASICIVCLAGAWIFLPHHRSSQQLLAFGAKGKEPGQLYHPTYMGLDGNGNIYIGDWGDGRINVFDSTGKFMRLISVGDNTNILGMAVAPGGTVYVSYDGVIHKLDANGNDTTLAYTDSNGDPKSDISGIALGPDGSLAAADMSGDVLHFGPDGTAKLLLPHAYDLPSFSSRNELDPSMGTYDVPANNADKNISVVVDGSGNIYALGWINATVLKTDSGGNSLSKFGGFAWFPGGWQRDLFYFPDAIAVDSYGRIYIGDSNGVQVFDVNEKYLYTISVGDSIDAMALDSQDNLYVVTTPYDHQLGELTEKVTKLAAQKP